jgi:hypothetical protein
MFDTLGELGSIPPWIYRGWLYLMSSKYRQNRALAWGMQTLLYKWFDISLSIVFMVVEILIILKFVPPFFG